MARCEARETLYRLRLLIETGLMPPPRLRDLVGEADQLVSVLTAIVKRANIKKR